VRLLERGLEGVGARAADLEREDRVRLEALGDEAHRGRIDEAALEEARLPFRRVPAP